MALGWRYTKPSTANVPLCVMPVHVCAIHPVYWVPARLCALPFVSDVCFFVCISFIFVVFALFLFVCSCWSFRDIPLIFFCLPDHVPD